MNYKFKISKSTLAFILLDFYQRNSYSSTVQGEFRHSFCNKCYEFKFILPPAKGFAFSKAPMKPLRVCQSESPITMK